MRSKKHPDNKTACETTADSFFNGGIKVLQPKGGYRFSIDAIMLAHHVRPGASQKILDLGTGCGIMPLVLAYRHPGNIIFGVELQAALAHIAKANIQMNRLEEQITIFHDNMKALSVKAVGGPVDIVISNPPYRKADAGRINPDPEKAMARHEIGITLKGIIQAGRRMVKTAGRFIIIYPAERTTDLLATLRQHNLEPKYLRTIHSYTDGEAKLILVDATKNGRPGMKIGPPLVIYEKGGGYTEEVDCMFNP